MAATTSIRLKLFLLLSVIAIAPMVIVTLHGHMTTQRLGEELADRTRAIRTENLISQLHKMVNVSAQVLRHQKESVELALLVQATAVERRLSAGPMRALPVFFAHQFDGDGDPPPGLRPSPRHVKARAGEPPTPMEISLESQVILLAPGVEPDRVADDVARLSTMTPVYSQLQAEYPNMFYWQYTSLETGVHSAYPGHGGYPAGYDPRRRAWYTGAVAAGRLAWSPLIVDASTRQITITASMPVKRPDGTLAGVTAIDVVIVDVLRWINVKSGLPEGTRTFLVEAEPASGGRAGGVRILAGQVAAGSDWRASIDLGRLESTDEAVLATVAADIVSGKAGMRRLPYDGEDSLWAYSPIDDLQTHLLAIVPFREIARDAALVVSHVQRETAKQLRAAGIFAVVVITLVAVLAVVCSRSVTKPIRSLVDAARRLAGGDFLARAIVVTADEIGELGRGFNEMVPQLQDRLQLRQSLALAKEVQQHLLPHSAPALSGFDIAGLSVYCDQIGGDYFDYIDLADGEGERLGIAVGDVSGHGVASALLMTTVRALLRGHTGDSNDLSALMGHINGHLVEDAHGGRFMTLLYIVITSGSRTLRWASAGHDPFLVYDPTTDAFDELTDGDIPLGIDADGRFSTFERDCLKDGRIVVAGTDGIWETRNTDGEMFGKHRLQDVVRRHARAPAVEICDAVWRSIADFRTGRSQEDDITLVIVKTESDPA